MKSLLYYMKRSVPMYILGFASMLAALVLTMISPRLTQSIIDDVIVGGKSELLRPLLISIILIGIGRAVFQYIREFSFDSIGVRVGCRIRRDLFHHIQGLSIDYFDCHNTGELLTRVKDDVDKVWIVLGYLGSMAFEAVVTVVMVIVCMLRISPMLTVVPVCILPVIGICAVVMENRLGKVYDEISDETARLNTVAQECIAGVRTVKAFAKEDYEIEKFESHNKQFYKLNMDQTVLQAKYEPVINFLGKAMVFAVVVTGGLMVIYGRLTLGGLGAFLEYANSIIWPMECAGWLSNDIAAAFASWKKIRKVADTESGMTDAKDARWLTEVKGDIIFDHVSFMLDGHEILHDISFHLAPGKTLGIMGMTGAGKTTIVNLLQRFYDVTDGRILLDGTDIRTLPLAQLRSSMAAVLQDVFLFSDTVEENVRMGRRDQIDTETVKWSLECAEASHFVGHLSQKEETVIGERGVGLSGGQRQRISIARALSRSAPVLILDDATSALDMETESLIQQNLKEAGSSAKIIIGHRISSVRDADEIIILENGRIAERGTDSELMNLKGRYYDIWRMQSNIAND